MAVAVLLLAVVLIYSTAYTVAMERTIHALWRRLAKGPEGGSVTSAQGAIIRGILIKRLNVAFLFGMALYLITARASTWHYGVLIVALCVIGSSLIGSIRNLRLGTAEMMAAILFEMEHRREAYKEAGDSLHLQAVEALLVRVRSVPRHEIEG